MKKQSEQKPSIRSIALAQQELNNKIDATRSELNTKIDATRLELNNRIGFLSSEMAQMNNRVDSIEKNVATKDDLKNFATKDDLKNFATKGDLKNFASKDDITNIIDSFIKRLETQENRAWTNVQRWKDLEPIVGEHEKRISALESRP